MNNRINPILDTDSYKLSHFQFYPPDTTNVYSYAESRGGKYDANVFFGLQKFVKELAEVRITDEDVYEGREFARLHGEPFNEQFCDLVGKPVPVRIKAVAEGTLVPTRNVLVTVENTNAFTKLPAPWLTSYIETPLLRSIWYPVTAATRIHNMKRKIQPFYDATSDVGDTGFALLDFSARGVSSRETAEVGGMAHLLSFMGSDNIPGILAARKFYDEPMAAFSVPATEHSVTTSWGSANELDSIEYIIDKMPENGILSMVADTWNVFEFVEKAAQFQERIRNKGGTLVIRPDSGEMRDVLPKVLNDARRLFGGRENNKGYDVLADVKILQGDGINEDTVTEPFQIAKELGISADSVMSGSGGGLMQANIDRDTCKFAFKASNVTRDGVDIPIAKDPITDPGKRSKKGRMVLVDYDGAGSYKTITVDSPDYKGAQRSDLLRTVYENGKLSNMETLSTIRERLNNQ